MSSAKAKSTRSSAQFVESPSVRKIHSRHTWVKPCSTRRVRIWKWIWTSRNWRVSVMVKVNPYHEKRFSTSSMKWRRERKNSTVSLDPSRELLFPCLRHFLLVSKQEIESLCTIFRHLTKGGDKGIPWCPYLSELSSLTLDTSLDKIDRNRFRDILHNTFDMTDDILMDRGMSPTLLVSL